MLTDMSYMFSNCEKLDSLYLSGLYTGEVLNGLRSTNSYLVKFTNPKKLLFVII